MPIATDHCLGDPKHNFVAFLPSLIRLKGKTYMVLLCTGCGLRHDTQIEADNIQDAPSNIIAPPKGNLV